MTLLAFAAVSPAMQQTISPACHYSEPANNSKPAAVACSSQMMGQMPDSFIDLLCNAHYQQW